MCFKQCDNSIHTSLWCLSTTEGWPSACRTYSGLVPINAGNITSPLADVPHPRVLPLVETQPTVYTETGRLVLGKLTFGWTEVMALNN